MCSRFALGMSLIVAIALNLQQLVGTEFCIYFKFGFCLLILFMFMYDNDTQSMYLASEWRAPNEPRHETNASF